MTLHPDKIAAALLYELYSCDVSEADHDVGYFNHLIGGVATPGAIIGELQRLERLGLVQGWGLAGVDHWSLTDSGNDVAFKLLSEPKSFLAKLRAGGWSWLTKPEAQRASMAPIFETFEIDRILADPPQVGALSSRIDWTKWSAILAGAGVLVAILIGLIG